LWEVPNTPSINSLVKISDVSNLSIYDVSDNSFEIKETVTPTITIFSPNGGEEFEIGTSKTISWSSVGLSVSESTFIERSLPGSGEVKGKKRLINNTNNNLIEITNVKIEYSTNNGSNWIQVIASTSNDGSYSWLVPNTPSSQCKVKISDVADPGVSDESDNTFSITSPGSTITSLDEDFELYTDFVLDFSPWTLVDVDGNTTFGIEDFDFNNEGAPMAYIIFNPLATSPPLTDNWEAHGGNKYAACFGSTTPPNNDWLISPQVTPGNSSELKFWARSLTSSYGLERFKVGVSTSSTSPQDFTIISTGSYLEAPADWTQFTFDLSAYEGENIYVGINCVSNDAFVFMVDDVTITSEQVASLITVVSPNGGENWEAGSTHSITWASENVDNVKLDYSIDNGDTWSTIVSSTPGNIGDYNWTVPDILPSNFCYVRISDASNPNDYDESDNPFSISSPQNPTVEVISPNGSEDWIVGSTHQILWSSEYIENIKISYSTNNGNSWPVIEASVPASSGSYEWVIPNTPSTECLVMVTNVDNENISDHSGGMFTISIPQTSTITVVSPNGGEHWVVGSTKQINWVSFDVIDVKIEYSVNNGTSCDVIVNSVSSTGIYNWFIPDIVSTQCLVKISEVNNPNVNDISNQVFTISTEQLVQLTLITPNGGEEWIIGSTYTAKWSSENVDNIGIEYSTDNGTSWLMVISSINANAGEYDWTIPNTSSADCLVKISDRINSNIYDESDQTFAIIIPTAAITLISPNGGSIIMGGTTQEIVWESENVENVKLELSTNNGANWNSIVTSASASAGNYNWTVPNVDAENCRVKISDAANENLFDESDDLFAVFKYLPTITISTSLNYFTGNSQPSYRIIGLPGSVNLPIGQVLSGNHGEDWRAFYDTGAETDYLVEYNGTNEFNFRPGRGFWVINRNSASINEVVNNITLSSDFTYSISLNSGWNIISNPFKKSINWVEVQTLNLMSRDIYWFNGSNYEQSSVFEFYKGYYFNNTDNLSSLVIPYMSGNSLAKPLAKNNGNQAAEIKVSLENGEQSLTDIVVGIVKDAKTGLDQYDKFTPRGDFVNNRIVIFNENLETNYKFLRKDYRTEIGDIQIYDLFINIEPNQLLTLNTEGIENFDEYNIYLIDTRLNNVYDLRKESRIDLKTVHTTNEYKLLIGKPEYTEELLQELIPKEFVLYQNYPNPFNPNTMIRFSLPKDDVILLEVYSILGEKVATLINSEKMTAGSYEIEFNGTGLTSGVYIYKIITIGNTQSNKMLLLK